MDEVTQEGVAVAHACDGLAAFSRREGRGARSAFYRTNPSASDFAALRGIDRRRPPRHDSASAQEATAA